jgi:hypothetical protein
MIGVERKYDLQEVLCNYIRYNQKTWTFNWHIQLSWI